MDEILTVAVSNPNVARSVGVVACDCNPSGNESAVPVYWVVWFVNLFYDLAVQGSFDDFSPEHTAENTGKVGENLGNSSAPGETPLRDLSRDEEDVAEMTEDHATDENVNRIGHARKTARARFDIQERLTEEGVARLSTSDDDEMVLSGDEAETTIGTAGQPYDDDLPGHDGAQTPEQIILRRDVDTVDQDKPGNHFVALMRFAPYMVYMRGR